jgi:hypothetical protein
MIGETLYLCGRLPNSVSTTRVSAVQKHTQAQRGQHRTNISNLSAHRSLDSFRFDDPAPAGQTWRGKLVLTVNHVKGLKDVILGNAGL